MVVKSRTVHTMTGCFRLVHEGEDSFLSESVELGALCVCIKAVAVSVLRESLPCKSNVVVKVEKIRRNC